MKTKVMTIIGTRPEIIKLSRVMAELERHTEHILVHTGQNYDYELNEIFFKDLKVKKPDYFLDSKGDTTAITIGNIISKSDKLAVMNALNSKMLTDGPQLKKFEQKFAKTLFGLEKKNVL